MQKLGKTLKTAQTAHVQSKSQLERSKVAGHVRDDVLSEFLLTLHAKGLPFKAISRTMRKYLKVNRSWEDLKAQFFRLVREEESYDTSPNNCMDRYDWCANEIKLLKYMRKHGVSLRRVRCVLCRSASQIKSQWKLINRPIL